MGFISVEEANRNYDQLHRSIQQTDYFHQGNLLLRVTTGYAILCDNLLRKELRKNRVKHQMHLENQPISAAKTWRCTAEDGSFYVPEMVTGFQQEEFLLHCRYKPLKMIGRGTYSCTILCIDTFHPHLSPQHQSQQIRTPNGSIPYHVAIKIMHAKPCYDNIGMQVNFFLLNIKSTNKITIMIRNALDYDFLIETTQMGSFQLLN